MKLFKFYLLLLIFTIGCASKSKRPNYQHRSYKSDSVTRVSTGSRSDDNTYTEETKDSASPKGDSTPSSQPRNYKSKPIKQNLLAEKEQTGDNQKQLADKNSADPKDKTATDKSKLNRRMIIYNARLHIAVFDPDKAVQRAIEFAHKHGGYLKSRQNSLVTLRVPSEKFFYFLHQFEEYGNITSRQVSSKDVTSQFIDLSMRLNNLIAARNRLKAIIKKTGKMKDILAVEKELTRVTGEIEEIKGKLRYLKNLVSFATIKLHFKRRQTHHGSGSYSKIKVDTPIQWIKQFDIISLFK
ncbi:MAG: DUF4349 domain-containing protein [Myxococcota bacterium]